MPHCIMAESKRWQTYTGIRHCLEGREARACCLKQALAFLHCNGQQQKPLHIRVCPDASLDFLMHRLQDGFVGGRPVHRALDFQGHSSVTFQPSSKLQPKALEFWKREARM